MHASEQSVRSHIDALVYREPFKFLQPPIPHEPNGGASPLSPTSDPHLPARHPAAPIKTRKTVSTEEVRRRLEESRRPIRSPHATPATWGTRRAPMRSPPELPSLPPIPRSVRSRHPRCSPSPPIRFDRFPSRHFERLQSGRGPRILVPEARIPSPQPHSDFAGQGSAFPVHSESRLSLSARLCRFAW